MNRILRIVLYAVIMFLIFLWVSSIYKSCQRSSLEEQAPATLEEPIPQEEDILSDLFEDDSSFEDNTEAEDSKDAIDYEQEDAFVAASENFEPETQSVNNRPDNSLLEQEEIKPVSRQTNGGKYLVISGSYLIRSNADVMVNKLKKMGFDKAEIVQFDLSQYHSICAGRYDSQSSAQSIVSQLKSQGIDSYVHIKKYN